MITFGFAPSSLTGDTQRISPFLMLDYAAPMTFDPTTKRRGVGQHPHRGFIVYAGEVEHRDSTGGGVTIAAEGDAKFLLLAGLPIDEPVVGYGPFVMNTREEIAKAVEDFNSGKFGPMPA